MTRHISGYITMTDQMYDATCELEEAIARHERRMETDPEYAEEWLRQQAEREDD